MADDKKFEFAIHEDGTAEIDGQVVERPGGDILDELPPAEALPEHSEIQRLRTIEAEFREVAPLVRALKEGKMAATLPEPPGPELPDPAPLAGSMERLASPDAPEITAGMKLYQEQLAATDPEAALRLENDPEFFNRVFDRFRELRPAPAQPEPAATRRDPRELEKIIASKEAGKWGATSAASRAQGSISLDRLAPRDPDYVDPRTKRAEQLKEAIRRNPTDTRLMSEFAKLFIGDDE